MDFLCYLLEKELNERHSSKWPGLYELLHAMATKIGDDELVTRVDRIRERQEPVYPFITFHVSFDYSSNRLNIECSSHYYTDLEMFKAYWEESRPFVNWASDMGLWELKGINVGEINTIKTQPPKPLKAPITAYPRYEDLRGLVYQEIEAFDFHHGYRITSYDDKTVKKELIERLRIRIYLSHRLPKNLYREFSDGNWKKLEIIPPSERK
jgi:hypothetical protein